MQKSMYSLMLMDSVVKKIDDVAQQKNTNRSNLINQILAEYVSLVTPEKQISEIFECLNHLFCSTVFDTVEEQCETMLSVKTSLNYKYRPTVKYSVELMKYPKDIFGYLKVIFRTQSAELLNSLKQFFTSFAQIESRHLKKNYGIDVTYLWESGKFVRSMTAPKGNDVPYDQLAKGICGYIEVLDEIIKKFLADEYHSFMQVEKRYLQYITNIDTVII